MIEASTILLVMYPVQYDPSKVILVQHLAAAPSSKVLDLAFDTVAIVTQDTTDQTSIMVVVQSRSSKGQGLVAYSAFASLPLTEDRLFDQYDLRGLDPSHRD